MRYMIDVADSKTAFAEEFFKSVSFVKRVKPISPNEITNTAILKSIEDYEQEKVLPTPLNLDELKEMLNA